MGDFLIACGGTGGHLSPGIAVAERLNARGYNSSLIVSRREVDSRLCRKYKDYTFIRTPGVPFSWNPVRMVYFGAEQLRALIFSLRLVRKARPLAIIAFGGYTSVAIALAGVVLRVPLILHEANRKPGRAVRWLARFADRIYLPSGIRIGVLQGAKTRSPGYPVRKEIRRVSRERARRALGIDTQGKLLVVFGGSQGAGALNEWVRTNLQALGAEGINVYCLTGVGKGSDGVFQFQAPDGSHVKATFTPFSDRMGDVLSSADLTVARAGAGSIAELIHCHTPSILIPYPYASDNHQRENAQFLERQGGCLVLDQTRLRDLFSEVRELIFNDWLLDRFRDNLRMLDEGDSAERIADDLTRLLRLRRQKIGERSAVMN